MTALTPEQREALAVAVNGGSQSVITLVESWLADALRKAAERVARYDDEVDEHDAAGLYVIVRHGGDPDDSAAWNEAYRVARLDSRPDRSMVDILSERTADLTRERDEARAALARVEALHQRRWAGGGGSLDDGRDGPPAYCTACSNVAQEWVPWPCPTVRALRGEP